MLLVDKPDASQTYFAIGNTGVAANDPDRVAIRVVNTIFGGRFTSELNEALRVESGYTYGAQSFFDQRKVPGPFVIFSFTKNETTTPAIDLALQVLAKLHKDGVTEEQLKSAKSYIKGQFPPNIETSRQLARMIAIARILRARRRRSESARSAAGCGDAGNRAAGDPETFSGGESGVRVDRKGVGDRTGGEEIRDESRHAADQRSGVLAGAGWREEMNRIRFRMRR